MYLRYKIKNKIKRREKLLLRKNGCNITGQKVDIPAQYRLHICRLFLIGFSRNRYLFQKIILTLQLEIEEEVLRFRCS